MGAACPLACGLCLLLQGLPLHQGFSVVVCSQTVPPEPTIPSTRLATIRHMASCKPPPPYAAGPAVPAATQAQQLLQALHKQHHPYYQHHLPPDLQQPQVRQARLAVTACQRGLSLDMCVWMQLQRCMTLDR